MSLDSSGFTLVGSWGSTGDPSDLLLAREKNRDRKDRTCIRRGCPTFWVTLEGLLTRQIHGHQWKNYKCSKISQTTEARNLEVNSENENPQSLPSADRAWGTAPNAFCRLLQLIPVPSQWCSTISSFSRWAETHRAQGDNEVMDLVGILSEF